MAPVDFLVIAFPGNQFKGEIIPELQKLVESNTINILDLLFITKDKDGEVVELELDDMPEEISTVLAPFKEAFKELLVEADVEDISDLLENNSSAGVLIYENVWASGLQEALLNAKGQLVADGRIHKTDIELALKEADSSKEGN